MRLVSELRRRNVLRMVVLYVVAAWLILQVAEVMIGLVKLPDWIGPAILGLLAVGFPIALIFSWFYEITAEGISLDKDVDVAESISKLTGRRLDFLVISLLSAALILFAWNTWWPSVPTDRSIAVMAFENMSNDPEQEYFSDGLSEELLNLLAQTPELRVISRSSSFSFKGKGIAIPTVAAQLNVAHVLEGSVRKMGNRVRITAQLIDARSDSHLWSETYDRELDDIFAVQDEIAAAISDALRVKLALVADKRVQPTAIKAANTDAYDAYLRGRALIRLRGKENLENAIRHLGRSLRLDENFAPAHAELAIASLLAHGYDRSTSMEEVSRIAISHLDRAQQLAPDLAKGYAGHALLAYLAGDPETQISYARKALASNPSDVDAMNWLQMALSTLGRYEEADETLQHMLATDPLSFIGRMNYARWLSKKGQVKEAHELANQLLAQDPRWGSFSHAESSLIYEGKIAEGLSWALIGDPRSVYAFVSFILAGEYDEARRVNESEAHWADYAEGRFDQAIQVAQKALQQDPDDQHTIWQAAEFLYTAGRIDEALPLYTRLLGFVPAGRPVLTAGEIYRSANESMMRLALARRKAGDEDGAQAAAQIARQDHAARRAAGSDDQFRYRTEAMIAAFANDPEGVITAVKTAVQRGLRDPQFFDDAIFENLRNQPRFVALQQELDAILAAEHEKVLQLICFNNPVSEHWQPMPETCEGVVEQRAL
jgi:TolB-like protein/Tfp pilus assembly protein PilF